MAGPVLRHHGESREHSVSWASRSSVNSPSRRGSAATGPAASPESATGPQYFSPSEPSRYEDSPLPIESPGISARPPLEEQSHTAPAVMHSRHRPLSTLSAGIPRHGELSYHEGAIPAAAAILRHTEHEPDDFELDPEAPIRAAKQRSADAVLDAGGVRSRASVSSESSLPAVEEEEDDSHSPPQPSPSASAVADSLRSPSALSASLSPQAPAEAQAAPSPVDSRDEGPIWGEPFQVEWIRTERLPFYRTRHLRNPWNHDREVKVSRDGTELEPSVGQALLEEWDKPEPPPQSRQGTKTAPPDSSVPKES